MSNYTGFLLKYQTRVAFQHVHVTLHIHTIFSIFCSSPKAAREPDIYKSPLVIEDTQKPVWVLNPAYFG
jgi:hypothetical protein